MNSEKKVFNTRVIRKFYKFKKNELLVHCAYVKRLGDIYSCRFTIENSIFEKSLRLSASGSFNLNVVDFFTFR